MCGRLGDLGSIDPKYDVAVSTAADMLDHVVVETAQGGQKCIEFLRAKNLGRANFIVLDQVKKAKGKPQTPDNAPRLLDLIEISDPKYADAFAMTLRIRWWPSRLTKLSSWPIGLITLDGGS